LSVSETELSSKMKSEPLMAIQNALLDLSQGKCRLASNWSLQCIKSNDQNGKAKVLMTKDDRRPAFALEGQLANVGEIKSIRLKVKFSPSGSVLVIYVYAGEENFCRIHCHNNNIGDLKIVFYGHDRYNNRVVELIEYLVFGSKQEKYFLLSEDYYRKSNAEYSEVLKGNQPDWPVDDPDVENEKGHGSWHDDMY